MAALSVTTESERGQISQGIYGLSDLRVFVSYEAKQKDAGDDALYWLQHALNPVAHESRQPDYSFSDLISLFVVRQLLRLGMSMRNVREAERYLRDLRHVDRPFVGEDIATDGQQVFFESEAGQVESANRGGGQQVQAKVIAPYLKSVRYDDGAATRWVPAPHVLVDPKVQFGDPVIAGSRVRTSVIRDIADVNADDTVALRLDLTPAQVRAAVEFERRLAALTN